MFLECETRPRTRETRVPDLVQHRGESPWLTKKRTVLIASVDRLPVNRSMPVFGICSRRSCASVNDFLSFFFSFTNLLAIEKNNVKASVLVFYRL